LMAHVTFANGTPVPQVNVTFTADRQLVGASVTSSNGVAEIRYVPAVRGPLNLTCYITGYPALSSAPVTLTVSGSQELYSTVIIIGVVVAIAVVITAYLAYQRKK